ncbi:hypothetical protein PIB30_075215 [Stylosanthes scabra]|uniref:Uncharacterized protein n=1 Tax=Stylosanthes scabra TaxID=79078 RepID=A0ABU6VNZ2_9FABA|nr:hypothetical protein [Stylosanthes scabra]
MNCYTAKNIGNELGVVTDWEEPVIDQVLARPFLRARVAINVNKPLTTGIWLNREKLLKALHGRNWKKESFIEEEGREEAAREEQSQTSGVGRDGQSLNNGAGKEGMGNAETGRGGFRKSKDEPYLRGGKRGEQGKEVALKGKRKEILEGSGKGAGGEEDTYYYIELAEEGDEDNQDKMEEEWERELAIEIASRLHIKRRREEPTMLLIKDRDEEEDQTREASKKKARTEEDDIANTSALSEWMEGDNNNMNMAEEAGLNMPHPQP